MTFPTLSDDAITMLLLACLRAETEAGLPAQLARLTDPDWAELIAVAIQHDIAPLLYTRLKQPPLKTAVPAAALNHLRNTFLGSVAQNTRRYHQLMQLLKTLQEASIPVIALKGTHLGEVIYSSVGVRTMCDVDLLVRESDLAGIEARLLALGYTPHEHNRQVAQDNKHFGYTSPKGTLYLEIHWHIVPGNYPFKVDVAGLWQRSQPATIARVPARVLSPSDLVLHLGLHLFDHWFKMGLKPYCDLAAAIQYYGPGVDWRAVERCAREWGMSKVAYLALWLSRELLAAAVPDEVLRALHPRDLDVALVQFVREQTLRGDGPPAPDQPPTHLAQLWGTKPLREKLAILLGSAFPSRAVLARFYPVPPDSLRIYRYYPVYIKDQFRRTGRALWRLLRRDPAALAAAGRENRNAALREWLAGCDAPPKVRRTCE